MQIYRTESRLKKQRFYRRLGIYAGIAAIFLLFVGVSRVVLFSSVFKAESVDISGGRRLSGENLLGALESEMVKKSKIKALLGRDNLFFWQKSDVLEAAGKIPLIAEMNFQKNYLEKKITMEIKERRGSGVWCLVFSEKCFWFDEKGMIISEAPETEGFLILKIDDYTKRPLETGGRILDKAFADNFFGVIRSLRQLSLGIREIRVDDLALQEFRVALQNGPDLLFSFRFHPEFLGNAFAFVKSKSDFSGLNYIDFRVENRVYYR